MKVKFNRLTAELVGILLGDGSFYLAKYNNEVDIALNSRDLLYKNYVKQLLEKVTSTNVTEKYSKSANCVHLRISRKEPVQKLLSISLIKPGNKIKNSVTIPSWVWNKSIFISKCVKGLIDTDGSVYRLTPHWPNLFQISFENHNRLLLFDTRRAFLELGFNPSKIFRNRIVLTRQNEIKRYFNEIGTSNDRNLEMSEAFERVYKDRN